MSYHRASDLGGDATTEPDVTPAEREERQERDFWHLWEVLHVAAGNEAMRDSVVYFVKSELTGLIKIGVTGKLRKRLRVMATATGSAIRPIVVFRGNRDIEAICHRVFDEYRVLGEWFRDEGLLTEFLEAMLLEPTSEPDRGAM